jgi:lysophospholipase L1-like esterase
MKRYFSMLLVLLLSYVTAAAQPFAEDIVAFRKQDSISFPARGQILFIGSSSFTLWKDVQQYFPSHPVINRGFGGSTLLDVTRYAGDVIFKYKPKQIVMYCGENDIAADSMVTGKVVLQRFKKLYKDIRNNLGNVPVVYISMKPSPSRWHMRARTTEGNRLIKKFLSKKGEAGKFVDVWTSMLNDDGLPKEDIFLGDKLHMNEKGYQLWKKILEPYLLKD